MITMEKFDKRLRWYHILIHRAIHDKSKGDKDSVTLAKGERCLIKLNGQLRYASYDGFTFIEQNPNKTSVHALEARNGKHITWGIPEDASKPWLYIDDAIATRFEEAINEHFKPAVK